MSVLNGFASLPMDYVARGAYIEEIPIIAECLPYQLFEAEMNYVLTSIAQKTQLTNKFIAIMEPTVKVLGKKEAYHFIYQAGTKFMSTFDSSLKIACSGPIEKILTDLGDIKYEIGEVLKPNLGSKKRQSKFAVWRLARLANLVPNDEEVKTLVYQEFTDQEELSISAELLPFLPKEEAQNYIVNAFISPFSEVKLAAVDTIGYHQFDNSLELINSYLIPENNLQVLEHVLKLPPQFVSAEFLKKLINHPDLGKKAVGFALKSPYLDDVVDNIIKNGCVGCELNNISIDTITKSKKPPYDLIAFMLRESTELIHEDIIKAIASLQESEVLFRIVFPRMGEKGSWRPRYAAVQIFQEIIKKKTDEQMLPDYAGFIIAMMLDHCYAIRKLVVQTLCMFPAGWVRNFTIESVLSLSKQGSDDFHKSILKMLFDDAAPILVGYEKQIENIKKTLNIQ